ncbi:Cobalt-zinc-cadmium resistance protein CzcB [Pseudoalteromonas holothuriae]|uniref:Cobalt-zinc-cadmium resistance protein CzcB n=1 Tax=Pseudoalteromonas holothuriae TaxID=2963714 RepID=A0ABM9GFM1_9GAMM|nr:efflux RND transporter periplasmic adaptor subunit [Pseudoalteromonas sp. CIP111951]CAH9050543.1 Cobalt-zinc-cadmium resistance protein CzcB [Pseudoalteromonas sp. CIP111951]
MFKLITVAIIYIALTLYIPSKAISWEDEHIHIEKNTEQQDLLKHDETLQITLTQTQQELANITVGKLQSKIAHVRTYAPGELKANGYTSYVVSPRTDSVIMTRHVALGERVKQGDKLVTLYSESMAQAQGDYIVAFNEWLRVKNMNALAVSESQRIQAKTRYLASLGKVTALGLTDGEINKLNNNSNLKLGQHNLYAQINGVVLQDNFSQGQRINTGQTLMLLADETNLWVEARLSTSDNQHISSQSTVEIEHLKHTYQARIIQESHTIDPVTRTRTVRLQVNNQEDRLHAGMFVNVYFTQPTAQPVITVPETALIQTAEGLWQIFIVSQKNHFVAVNVKRGRQFDEQVEVIGIAEGSEVVTQGAFFISSELAKNSFDIHNH